MSRGTGSFAQQNDQPRCARQKLLSCDCSCRRCLDRCEVRWHNCLPQLALQSSLDIEKHRCFFSYFVRIHLLHFSAAVSAAKLVRHGRRHFRMKLEGRAFDLRTERSVKLFNKHSFGGAFCSPVICLSLDCARQLKNAVQELSA